MCTNPQNSRGLMWVFAQTAGGQRGMVVGITLEQRGDTCVVCLEGAIDIACAADLKSVFLEALKLGKTLRVETAKAAGVDVTAIQLLWAAEREAKARGLGFAVADRMPEPVLAAFLDAGFDTLPTTE